MGHYLPCDLERCDKVFFEPHTGSQLDLEAEILLQKAKRIKDVCLAHDAKANTYKLCIRQDIKWLNISRVASGVSKKEKGITLTT